jgi:hypothetical protein
VFKRVYGRDLAPDEREEVAPGKWGIVLEEEPNKPLPIGCARMYNRSERKSELRDTIEDSICAASGLFEGQIDRAAASMEANAMMRPGSVRQFAAGPDGAMLLEPLPLEDIVLVVPRAIALYSSCL